MRTCISIFAIIMVFTLALVAVGPAAAGQVWTKCSVTCRCARTNDIGNFTFVIPIDRSPDIGFEADMACNNYGYKVCSDGCNGLKFAYTYQVTSP